MFVEDSCVPAELYEQVLRDETFFASNYEDGEQIATSLNSYHGDSKEMSSYMFWDGWEKSQPRSLKHLVIKEIWEKRLPFPIEEVIGFEYWTRTFESGQFIGEHVDEDTFAYLLTGTFYGPRIGCVWYGCDNDDGGFLEIHNSRLEDGSTLALEPSVMAVHASSPQNDRERLRYKGNRLIVFDSGHVVHNTTPAGSRLRQVMVINVWTKDVPPMGLATGDFAHE
jgi:hypothetical protein